MHDNVSCNKTLLSVDFLRQIWVNMRKNIFHCNVELVETESVFSFKCILCRLSCFQCIELTLILIEEPNLKFCFVNIN